MNAENKNSYVPVNEHKIIEIFIMLNNKRKLPDVHSVKWGKSFANYIRRQQSV